MIEIKALNFSYGSKHFIEDLDTAFGNGTLTAIIGENGSGKSTLLKLICGELKSRSGTILIDGKDKSRLSRREIAKRLSYFPQGREIPDMTALELVTLGRYPHGNIGLSSSKKDRDAALSALEYVGALHFADIHLKKASFGERQRIYLAMQIAQNAKSCLLDEPTNFLDIGAKFSMMDVLVRLKNEGKCVVCVLHDITLAMRYADRIVLMKDGRILADGSPQMLCESNAISDAFGITLEQIEANGEVSYLTKPKNF